MSKTTTKSKASNGSAGKGLQGRRFTSKQKEAALALVAAGVLPRASIAELMGTTPESVRRWVREAEAKGSEDAEPSSSGTEEIAQAATVAASAGNNGASGKVAQSGKRSLYAPKDPGQGLGEYEVAAILELKKKHPSMGPTAHSHACSLVSLAPTCSSSTTGASLRSETKSAATSSNSSRNATACGLPSCPRSSR